MSGFWGFRKHQSCNAIAEWIRTACVDSPHQSHLRLVCDRLNRRFNGRRTSRSESKTNFLRSSCTLGSTAGLHPAMPSAKNPSAQKPSTPKHVGSPRFVLHCSSSTPLLNPVRFTWQSHWRCRAIAQIATAARIEPFKPLLGFLCQHLECSINGITHFGVLLTAAAMHAFIDRTVRFEKRIARLLNFRLRSIIQRRLLNQIWHLLEQVTNVMQRLVRCLRIILSKSGFDRSATPSSCLTASAKVSG